jgi:actin-like ATPase involved in cell morphogenesis
MSWSLAIDFGTTHTAAAVASDGKIHRLEFDDGQARIPSLIWIGEDGTVYVGKAAQRQRGIAPHRMINEPKSDLGVHSTITVEGRDHPTAELVGELLKSVVEEAIRRYGGRPREIRLTHPAGWGPDRIAALKSAAAAAGITDPVLVPEPEAAAFALATQLQPGQKLAVYDFGGGTFDTAVLERTKAGFALSGVPGGREIGGERFDDRLLTYLGKSISYDYSEQWEQLRKGESTSAKRKAADLRAEVREAKEELSRYESQHIKLPFEDADPVLISRPEFEELIEDDVEATFELLEQTIADANLSADQLQGIYLTGGSSRIRLVENIGRRRYGDRLVTRDDPKMVVALGALGWEPGERKGPPPPPKRKSDGGGKPVKVPPERTVEAPDGGSAKTGVIEPPEGSTAERTVTIGALAVLVAMAVGSFLPFVQGANYWEYFEGASPLIFIQIVATYLLLPLIALGAYRLLAARPMAAAITMAAFAGVAVYDLIDLPGLRGYDYDSGIGAVILTLGSATALGLLLYVARQADLRLPLREVDPPRKVLPSAAAGLGAVLLVAAIAGSWDEALGIDKAYWSALLALVLISATALVVSRTTASALSLAVTSFATFWWFVPVGSFFSDYAEADSTALLALGGSVLCLASCLATIAWSWPVSWSRRATDSRPPA